ncbi:MAG: glycosyl transferase [Oscillatoriales cyanobacterium RM2_1_1]|nr:glycosyl transferase [Oscillatoriales cyanobacterium SM2_3_0]NJO45730.1 glycosyl transferase [Oscillatoriales cyanobacterium RM2_1_1]
MARPTVYLAITNHGFGHAVRAASIAAQIQRLLPDCLLILVTTAPRWLLESYIPGDFILRPRALDVGVIQSDSLTMDLEATLEKLQHIHHQRHSIIAGEVNFIQQNRVDLILADIPPLAAAIAKAAGIPGWMLSNFGWDFIYRAWGGEFLALADWIAECFGQCDRLFRLPMHEPMTAFPEMVDVGLTGGDPRYDLERLGVDFGIHTAPEKTILLSFGGLGLAKIPYENLGNFAELTFITFDSNAPNLPNLVRVRELIPALPLSLNYLRIRPVDFMPLCGRVVSKPGFSTYAEAMRLDIPIVSLSRQGFAESPLLLEGLQNHSWHQILAPAEFFTGTWEFLHRPLQPPRSDQRLDKTGSETIAQAVVKALGTLT